MISRVQIELQFTGLGVDREQAGRPVVDDVCGSRLRDRERREHRERDACESPEHHPSHPRTPSSERASGTPAR
ncbi:hypothetical protein GCM10025869_27480 [Homoserinibacter gongjuensis]|uniref:Uncharacterized protein n=1 Tax=Homoserinibacter gongjuensis TaxID=1162968 RepID=A0ABQ6JW18_9MICO|nr:hypothetical protein GCM10025869_27480 [Homoserinibacter gongjuensis]